MDKDLAEALRIARETGRFEAHYSDLEELPIELASMEDLTTIYVSGLLLRDLPSWLTDLPALTQVWVLVHSFTVFPRVLMTMRNLESLIISGGNLIELPDEPGELLGLKELSLSDNKLLSLPDWMADFACLTKLGVGENNLRQLPRAMGAGSPIAKTLEVLEIWGNRFRGIPEEVGAFGTLRYLNVSGRGIEPGAELLKWHLPSSFSAGTYTGPKREPVLAGLPNWLATALPELEGLVIDDQILSSLPESLHEMSNLRFISARNNRISQFPEDLHWLRELEYVDFSDNRIQGVRCPERLTRLTKLERLKLEGNQLDIPPEILEAGNPSRIIDYLTQVGRDRRSLNEAKLLVVGEGSVGKTSLIRHGKGKII